MQFIHVGAAVLNQTPLAWDANRANIVAAIRAARERGVSVLCLPELCISGYGCEDAFHSPGLARMAWKLLQEIVPHTQGIIVSLVFRRSVPKCRRIMNEMLIFAIAPVVSPAILNRL